jgi:hypothetical protein
MFTVFIKVHTHVQIQYLFSFSSSSLYYRCLYCIITLTQPSTTGSISLFNFFFVFEKLLIEYHVVIFTMLSIYIASPLSGRSLPVTTRG